MAKRINRRRPPAERFRHWFDPSDDPDACLPWQGALNPNGYGTFTSEPGRTTSVHIYAWEEVNGPVPAGHEIHHNCRNRACVNHKHLEALTRAEHLERHRKERAA